MTIDEVKQEVLKAITQGVVFSLHGAISYVIALQGYIDEELYLWCLDLKF